MSDIDHVGTDEVVCPHCGNVHEDSWEFFGNEESHDDAECDKCGKSFWATKHISVTYNTGKNAS